MISLRNRIGRRAVCALVAVSATFAASTGFAATSGSATSGSTPRSYDGLWSVSIVTEKGDCDRGYRYPIRIAKGVLVNAGDTAFTISGKVAQTGAITVTVSAAGKSATGSGHLARGTGTGSWRGGECSGTWTAERRGA